MVMRMDRGRILVIDDSAIIAETIADGLVEQGWAVETAETGLGALELRERWGPDAVVCDLHMPHIDGVGMLRRLHDADDSLPVILMSSDSKLDSVLRAVREGAFDYVVKDGADLRPLTSAVERAVRHARLVRENRQLSAEVRRHRDELELRVKERTRELESAQEMLVVREKMASLGALAAGVAHEINNPAAFILANLSTMRSHIQSLLRGDCSPEQIIELRDMVDENVIGIDRIRSIIKDLRNFSRIERDDVELVQVNELVDASCNMAACEIKHRARLRKDLGELPLIPADRGKLSQVLINLLINAAHAIGEEGGDRMEIRVSTRWRDGSILISVEDTGCGIPDDVRARIFEPFFTTKPRDVGTGLGLSMSADIVRRHGGTISVASTVGVGTRFDVQIPVGTGLEVHTPAAAPAPPCPETGSTRKARILVVDDEPDVLRTLSRALRGRHDVVLADGGPQALTRLEYDEEFDVVLCDREMPELDGAGLHEAVRLKAPRLAERFVFIAKPIALEQLSDAVTRALQVPTE